MANKEHTQTRLRLGILDDAEAIGYRVLDQIEKWSSGHGKGVVADALGMAFSTFSSCLRRANRCRFSMDQFIAVLVMDDTGQVLASLCEAVGYESPKRIDRRTDRQRLEALTERLREFGEVGERLIKEAGL